MQIVPRPLFLLRRQRAADWKMAAAAKTCAGQRIIERMLLSTAGAGEGTTGKGIMSPPSLSPQQQPLLVEPQIGEDKGILIARMNVPRTKNALSRALLLQFRELVETLRYDRGTRVLVLSSAVAGTFCTGADLKERKLMSEFEVFQFVDCLRRTFNEISALPFPVVAAIDGFALGGGLELALACDIRIASPRSKMGLTETKLAIIPGAGGTQRLPRIIGQAKAKELIFTGKMLSGDEAANIGLINHLANDPFEKSLEIARDVLKTGPIASKMAKLAIDQGAELELSSGLVVEQQCYAQLMATKDRLEALEAFGQKREPIYRGE